MLPRSLSRLLAALVAFAFVCAAPAAAQAANLPLLGAGGTGAAAAQYVPNASFFTQEASPTIAASTIAASPYFDVNFWFRCTQGINGQTQPDKYQSCYNGVLVGNWSNTPCAGLNSAEAMPGLNIVWESGEGGGTFRWNINNSHCNSAPLGTPNNNNSANASLTSTDSYGGAWHHMRFYGDANCSSAANVRCGGVYIDNTQVAAGIGDLGSGGWTAADKNIAFGTAAFFIGAFDNTAPSQAANGFEIAQFTMDTSVSPVVATSNTPVNAISNFLTAGGLPVDYGSDCSGPFGHQPTLCNTGAGSAFLTNTGSLAANFTITQQFTNTTTNKVFAAASAPGETPDRPFPRWNYSQAMGCAETVGGHTCVQGKNLGNPALIGDLLCAVVETTGNAANYNDAFTVTGGIVTTWTDVLGGTAQNGNYSNTSVWCGPVTTAVASGALMAAPTIGWTANATGWAAATVTMVDIGKYGAGGTTPLVNMAGATNSSVSVNTLPCPTLTAPAGLSLWMCGHTTYDFSFGAPSGVGPATTSTLLGKLPATSAGNRPMIEYEKLSGAGSIARTAQGSNIGGNKSLGFAVIFN